MRNNKDLTKYVYSSLLGDASISIDNRDWEKNGNATFEISQTADHLDYLEHLQNKLQDITTFTIKLSKPEKIRVIDDHTSNCKAQYRLRSSRHPFFNTFRERLYGTGRKIVDPHYLKLLDWEMMATFYMDDGYVSHTNNTNRYDTTYRTDTLGISTQGYSYGDNLLLKESIREKLEVEFNVREFRQKNGNLQYMLKLRGKDIPRFIDNVREYIVPSYKYKTILEGISHTKNSSQNEDDDIV